MHADSLQKNEYGLVYARLFNCAAASLCHGSYCKLILSLARTSCRLLCTARPPARPLAGNPLRDAVRSRNPSKSTLAHDTVATAVLHKHHPIIRVSAGLIQFVYRSHLRLATEATRNRNAFLPFFAQVFVDVRLLVCARSLTKPSSAPLNKAPVSGCRHSSCVLILHVCLCVCASVCAYENV